MVWCERVQGNTFLLFDSSRLMMWERLLKSWVMCCSAGLKVLNLISTCHWIQTSSFPHLSLPLNLSRLCDYELSVHLYTPGRFAGALMAKYDVLLNVKQQSHCANYNGFLYQENMRFIIKQKRPENNDEKGTIWSARGPRTENTKGKSRMIL